jgi:hypothetical protein
MPRFPAPPDAEVTWVARDIEFNGMPMSARKFTSEDSVQQVLAFYKQMWRAPLQAGVPGYIEQETAGWTMITRIEDGFMLSVQAKPYLGDGAWGYLGMSKIDELDGEVKLGKSFPKMHGSKVVNDIKHNDNVKNGRTVMLQNKYSISSNANFYREYYLSRGWNMSIDKMSVTDNVHAFAFKKGADEVTMTIARTPDGSQVVANIIK